MDERSSDSTRRPWVTPSLVRLTAAYSAELNFNTGWDIDGTWTGYPGYS